MEINILNHQKKKCQEEKKNSNETGEHDKFYDDNLSRKCKRVLLDILFTFINSVIRKVYNNNIGSGIFRKQLLKNNQNQILSSKADYNKDFLNKKLKDIYSDDISTRYSIYPPEHNKYIIENLLNEKEEKKRKI